MGLYATPRRASGMRIGMIGAFLGIRGALFTVCVGSVLGVVIGLSWIKLTKQDASTYPLPLGTFLGIASLIAAVAIRDLPMQ